MDIAALTYAKKPMDYGELAHKITEEECLPLVELCFLAIFEYGKFEDLLEAMKYMFMYRYNGENWGNLMTLIALREIQEVRIRGIHEEDIGSTKMQRLLYKEATHISHENCTMIPLRGAKRYKLSNLSDLRYVPIKKEDEHKAQHSGLT